MMGKLYFMRKTFLLLPCAIKIKIKYFEVKQSMKWISLTYII